MLEALERARTFLWSRRGAYRATFDLSNARSADVLADLARFCRAHASTAHADPYMAARLDGRREVWNRIQNHLQLTDEQLWRLYGEGQ